MRIGIPQSNGYRSVFAEVQQDVRYRCPCCGYPTLPDRDHHSHCIVCQWEDDGQDDPHADEVRGGANYLYSLTQARNNFRDHLNQYDTDDPSCDDDTDATREAKRKLIAIFDAIAEMNNEQDHDRLWRDALEAEKSLREERGKRFSDREWFEQRGERWLEYREMKEPGYLARREKRIAIWRARHPRKGDPQG